MYKGCCYNLKSFQLYEMSLHGNVKVSVLLAHNTGIKTVKIKKKKIKY